MRVPALCAVIVLLIAAASGCRREQTLPPPRPTPQVQVATPLQREVVEWAEFTGRLEAIDFVEIRSRVSGYLASVHFEDGQVVEKGDLLFVIDPRPFEAAFKQAQAALVEAQAQLVQSQARMKAAEAQDQKVAANLTVTSRGYERSKSLSAQNAISIEEVDIREGDFLQATADVAAAQAGLAEAQASIETAKAAMESAKTRVEIAELDLSYTNVKAPVTGRVSRTNVTEGNLISGGSEQSRVLTTIVSTDPVYFVFDASEQQVLRFQRMTLAGNRQSARDVKYPVYLGLVDEKGFPHSGYLDFVDNRFNPTTATMMARATFENPDGVLTPGIFGKLRLAETTPFDGLLVPDAAISTDQSDQLVYVVSGDSRIEPRRVETGSMAHGLRIIRSGITAEDRVVISGLQRVRPGIVVEPQVAEITAAESGLSANDALPFEVPQSATQAKTTNADSPADASLPVEKK